MPTFEARSYGEAMRIAEERIPGANALPGTHPKAAAHAQVIGVKMVAA